MMFRELTVTEVTEVLRRWLAGQSVRDAARGSSIDRKTARRYIEAAKSLGLTIGGSLDEEVVTQIVMRVRKRPELDATEVEPTLQRLRPRIELWLNRTPRPMRFVRIHELLVRDGYQFSYSALLRFARRELGWRERPATVLIDNAPLGEEAQIDSAWTKMRQGYGLLRLCEKYGASTVNALCEHSLAFDVVDVPRMESMLKAGWTPGGEQAVEGKRSEPCIESRRTELGGRFARDPASFATQAKEEKP